MVYKTKGTCSSEIEFEVENGILTDIHFVGGCQGNTTGVAALSSGSVCRFCYQYLLFVGWNLWLVDVVAPYAG